MDLLGILRIKDSNGNWVSVPGLKGDTGEPFKILGIYATAADLEASVTDPNVSDVYLVGTTGAYDIYLYLADGWHNTGRYMPKGDQGDPAPAASITSAVETWLAANVDPETGYVLDRTLVQEDAAAPADLVGDLKIAVGNLDEQLNGAGTESFPWELGAIYYSGGVASYGNSQRRIRTPEGQSVSLKAGDTIGMEGFTDLPSTETAYLITYYVEYSDGTAYGMQNASANFTLPKDGNIIISLRKRTETDISSIEELSDKFVYIPITEIEAEGIAGKVELLLGNYFSYIVPDFVKGVDVVNADFDVNSETRLQDLYQWYDQLAAAHSATMTKVQYGTSQTPTGFRATVDDNVYPMYAYVINPLKTPKHKIILAYGIHGNGSGGDAINGVVALAYFIRQFLNKYNENYITRYMRDYCTLVVMPCLNPWGYQNNSRGNGRNIDLNRNFSVGFEANTTDPTIELAYFPNSLDGTPEPIVAGENAFSEAESVAIRDYITTYHSDADYMLEGHSRGERNLNWQLLPTVQNRFLIFVKQDNGVIDTTFKAAFDETSELLTTKYGGTKASQSGLEAKGQCFRYFMDTLDIPGFETESCGCYGGDANTFGTDMTEIQSVDFIGSNILAVTELLLMNDN